MFVIGRVKDFMKKDIDSAAIISVIICFPIGILKLNQTENRVWSIIFGLFLIVSSIVTVIELIKTKGKRA